MLKYRVKSVDVILLASGEHEIVTSFARCLSEAGKTVIIIGVNKCKGSILSPHCKEFYEVPLGYFTEGSSLLVKLINKVVASRHCEVIIPISIPAAIFLDNNRQDITDKIKISPLSDTKLILKLHNKWYFYCWLKELNLPTPLTILLENSEQAANNMLDFPFLTKPWDGAAGEGIKYYWNKKDYETAPPTLFPIIMQEYMPGWDMGVSLYSVDGEIRATTTQRPKAGNFDILDNQEALAICRQVLAAAKYSGLSNFDLRYDERDGIIKCLECNPRAWGSIYVSNQAGLNFPLLVFDVSRDGCSSVPNTVSPQWVPNPTNLWNKVPNKEYSQRRVLSPIIKKYFPYLITNFSYELYRIFASRSPYAADKWFSTVLIFNGRIRNKQYCNK